MSSTQSLDPNVKPIYPLTLVTGLLFSSIGLAFDAYITNERSGDLIRIDQKGRTVDVISICKRPRGMVRGPEAHEILIACSDDDKVIAFDRFTRIVNREFLHIPGAMSLAVHPTSNRLFVTNEGFSSASVIDLVSGAKIANLPTGLEPDGIAINETGSKIFVVSENAGLIHVFDGTSYNPVASIKTNLRPRRIILNDDELWVSSEMGSRVEIFDSETFRKVDEIVFAPRGFRPEQMTPVDILLNETANEAYVALGSANHVAIVDINTHQILKYILVGRRAWGLGLTPDASTLIVLNGLSDDFTMIDLSTKRPIFTRRAGLTPNSIEIFE